MKYLILAFVLTGSFAFAQTDTETGTNPMGPPTMGQPEYSNSGEYRDTNVDANPTVPDRTPQVEKQKQESETQYGPYKNGKYQFLKKSF
ncbi:MAG: hypothetical protein ACJ76H_13600 [Bacteriovoracaceae bacterium]